MTRTLSPLVADMAARLQAAFASRAEAFTLRRRTAMEFVAASGAAASATSITLSTGPSGVDDILTGDTFGGVYEVSTDTAGVSGTFTNIPFSPAIVTAIPAGGRVTVFRTTDHAASGWIAQVRLLPGASPQARRYGARVVILKNTLDTVPTVGDRIIDSGDQAMTIDAVGLDSAGAAWTIEASW